MVEISVIGRVAHGCFGVQAIFDWSEASLSVSRQI